MDSDDGATIATVGGYQSNFDFTVSQSLDGWYEQSPQLVDPRLKDRDYRCPKVGGSFYQNQDYISSEFKISKHLLELYAESGVTNII